MRSFIVTGVNRGLGKAIRECLSVDDFDLDQKIFLSRYLLNDKDSCARRESDLAYDFSEGSLDFSAITINSEVRQIVFISNAGVIEPIGAATDIDTVQIASALQVNCLSPLKLAQHLASHSKVTGIPLLIIDVSSGAASRPVKGWLSYCVSKAAAKMAFDVMASENPHVKVVHFDPGVMDTKMQEIIRGQSESSMPDVEVFRGFKADDRLKSPADVAHEVLRIIIENRS
ncbi:SDR family NAD(P)-dependent oxidoreductase [Pseudomonas putida]|uniref:SDR family NAD(P)-dependent oxidoreductase n=1 Tax=Pseudomonas putida TaxID=303 RepID=UPI003CFCA654